MTAKRTTGRPFSRIAFGGLAIAALASCGGDSSSPNRVATVTVMPANTSLFVGSTEQLAAELKNASGGILTDREVTWASSNGLVASVDQTGLVTGEAIGGPVQITATSEGQIGVASVTVEPIPEVCDLEDALPIEVGQTLNGTLMAGDCELDDNTFFDIYFLTVTVAVNVQIELRSAAFDAFLFLLDSDFDVLAVSDDDGGGTDALVFGTLQPGTYFIIANSLNEGETGAYTIGVLQTLAANSSPAREPKAALCRTGATTTGCKPIPRGIRR